MYLSTLNKLSHTNNEKRTEQINNNMINSRFRKSEMQNKQISVSFASTEPHIVSQSVLVKCDGLCETWQVEGK